MDPTHVLVDLHGLNGAANAYHVHQVRIILVYVIVVISGGRTRVVPEKPEFRVIPIPKFMIFGIRFGVSWDERVRRSNFNKVYINFFSNFCHIS